LRELGGAKAEASLGREGGAGKGLRKLGGAKVEASLGRDE
jgi:hypothetical protein